MDAKDVVGRVDGKCSANAPDEVPDSGVNKEDVELSTSGENADDAVSVKSVMSEDAS